MTAFCGTQRFTTIFALFRHWSLPLAKEIRPTPSLPGALEATFKVMQHLGILSCNNLVNQAIENLQHKTKFRTVPDWLVLMTEMSVLATEFLNIIQVQLVFHQATIVTILMSLTSLSFSYNSYQKDETAKRWNVLKSDTLSPFLPKLRCLPLLLLIFPFLFSSTTSYVCVSLSQSFVCFWRNSPLVG